MSAERLRPMRYLPMLALAMTAAATQAAESPSIVEGREIAADRNRGNCYSCHMADGAEMTGNGGPPLIQMQLRFPDREVLKAQIADPRVRNPNTVMPPYGAHGILTARELELVVDYIHSL
ncbi:MAG: sulfur-oxidizing protein SoxX [Glaciecola sp.]|jgi:sulfur-oxidizing protein SoxX|uniref:sulfur oxidation c-type cytochrome SoxX n=1 Tax=Congregibacter sp. TaxID=2744308 RepID=UPI0039E30F13